MEFGGEGAALLECWENNDLALKSDVFHGLVLVTFAKGRWVQAPKELTLSVLKTLVEVFRRGVPTRRQEVLNAPRRIVLSFAPSAAAGRHFDRVEATYDSKTERRTFFS